MTTATAPTTTPQLRPVSVCADFDCAIVDGVEQRHSATIRREGSPYGGYYWSVDWTEIGEPKMVDRADWDDAHPGVEPTPAAMRELLSAASDDIVEAIIDCRESGRGW